MTYPLLMPTVDVTVGSIRHLETSDDLQYRVLFEAVQPSGDSFAGLIWAESGERFVSLSETMLSRGGEMRFTLPATNAEGWKNFDGAYIDTDGGTLHTHGYRVRLYVVKDKTQQSSVILDTVFLPEGVSPVDLDDLISVPQEPGTPINFPDVWGALVQQAEAAALAAQQAAQDAESAAELVRDNSIVDASLAGQDLVFEKYDLSTINLGRVVGLSAYEQSGFSGTLEEWIASLQGTSVTGGEGPPVADGLKDAQTYLDVSNGDVYLWLESAWWRLGSIASDVPGPPNTLTAGTVAQIPSGGQPTFSITGTAPDQTLNLGLVDGSPTAFELRGEGFPGTGSNATATNAVSPGTYYTDTLGTSGAWRWLKTSAGTGNARWVVALGDTGPRNVNGELSNGWVSFGGHQLTLLREGSTVTLSMANQGLDGVDATARTFITLPQGFRWARRDGESQGNLGIARRWVPANAPTVILAQYASSTSRLELETGSGARYTFEISFKTLDPWPATLPGIPR